MNTLRNLLAITPAGEIVQHPSVQLKMRERIADFHEARKAKARKMMDHYAYAEGVCASCKEHTGVMDSCCGDYVYDVDGSRMYPAEYEEQYCAWKEELEELEKRDIWWSKACRVQL
jgi:hypothetical protein